ncbi:heme-binding protein [Mycolicibacterium sp.]|uniref:heme-binding protein n=1 Tax=Mycolicibacterium sp. TaxID=2320850 RepID=UPI0028B00400|nr:heme-binding protein [Mycolicibacterium sp.]
MKMKISGFATVTVMGGLAVAALSAPVASADDVCSAGGVASTVNTVTGSAQQYLAGHPGAGQVLYAAMRQSPAQAAADVRGYFTANPREYYELRGILAPIGDVQQQCNVTVLPPTLQAAYNQFMAG